MRYRDYLLKLKLFDEYKSKKIVMYFIRDAKKILADILANSKISKGTWRAINLLTKKLPPANTSITSGISPHDLNNHFCSVAR